MANPIILYDSRFMDGTPTATDTAAGFSVLNIKDYRTYTFWKAASSGTKYITIDCAGAKSANCLAIIAHNLYTAGATVSVESSPDNSNWTVRLAEFTPASDKALLKIFTDASAPYWRIKIVTASMAAQIGVVFLGARMDFPYPPDAPYIPYTEGIEAETSIGKTGHILGSTIKFKPLELTARFSNLTRTWVLNTFKVFWDTHASDLKPFFYAWDIDAYPDMVFFVAVDDGSKYQTPVSILQYIDSIELRMRGAKE